MREKETEKKEKCMRYRGSHLSYSNVGAGGSSAADSGGIAAERARTMSSVAFASPSAMYHPLITADTPNCYDSNGVGDVKERLCTPSRAEWRLSCFFRRFRKASKKDPLGARPPKFCRGSIDNKVMYGRKLSQCVHTFFGLPHFAEPGFVRLQAREACQAQRE